MKRTSLKNIWFLILGTFLVFGFTDDVDGDGIITPYDNCPSIANSAQIDSDGELYFLTKGDGWVRKLVAAEN